MQGYKNPRDVARGKLIAAARRSAGLSQPQLAKLVGMHKDTIAKWERGARAPDPLGVRRLHEYLHIPFLELI